MTAPSAGLLAAALWGGTLVSAPWWSLGPAVLAACGAGLLRRSWLRLAAVALAVAVAGAALAGGRAAMAATGPLARLAAGGGTAAIGATAVSDARIDPFGASLVVQVDAVDGTATRVRAVLRLPALRGAGAPGGGSAGRVEPSLPQLGEHLVLRASARPLDARSADRALRSVHAIAVLAPVGAVRVVATAAVPLRVVQRVRDRVQTAARARLDADAAALLVGLVTGDTSGASQERLDQLRAAGLSHLTAVSGSNVALALAGAVGLAAAVGIGARGRRRAATVALVVFVVLVRAEPSVLRAAVLAALVLLARATGRDHEPVRLLAFAVVLALLADPLLARRTGFALSVLAAAGVLVVAPVLADRLPGPRPIRLLVAASAAAQLAVAPLLLAIDGGVPLAALPANLVAVPAAAVASAIGIAVACLAQVWVGGAGLLAMSAAPAITVVHGAGALFADGWRVEPHHLASPVAAVLLIAVVARRSAPRLALVALACTATLAVVPVVRPAGAITVLAVTVLDVGQGDAVLVEAPTTDGRGARLLVDGGPEPGVAARLLRSMRVRRLDAVALSHAHADHSDGLPQVLRRIPVGVVLVAPAPLLPGSAAPSAAALLAAARARQIPVRSVGAGDRLRLGTALVEVLAPAPEDLLSDDLNEHSLVLRISGPTGAVLLTGDAETGSQTRLLGRPDLLRADVVKVPHHGGATNAAGFLAAVGASTAILSVGRDNDYGHPAPGVLAELATTTVVRTDLDGTTRVLVQRGAAATAARAPPTPPTPPPPPG